jgi:hypothetical protein
MVAPRPRRTVRFARPTSAVLAWVAFAACDPTTTDPSYWERAPSASVASGGEGDGDGDGDGDPSGGGAAAPDSSAAPSSSDSGATGNPTATCASIALTTVSYGGEYEPENVGAVWLTEDGTFVRTLERWGSQRLKNAVAWRASSSGNDVDAITGATRDEHGSHDLVWDCRDADGGLRDAGVFELHAEFTEDDSAEGEPPGPHRVMPFDLAVPGPIDTPDDATFQGVRVVVRP